MNVEIDMNVCSFKIKIDPKSIKQTRANLNHKKYREKNKVKVAICKKEYNRQHKDQVKVWNHTYYKKNREKILARKKLSYQKNKRTEKKKKTDKMVKKE